MAKDLISVAIGELGYTAGKNNYTKYGAWIGQPNCQWCQAFVTWCCYQAGVGNRVSKTADSSQGMAYFKERNRFEWKESYFPQRNDIIYFKSNGASHVGIVENATNGIIYTVEGNSSNKVCRRTYKSDDKTITGYGLLYIDESDAPGGKGAGYEITSTGLKKPVNVKVNSNSNNTITVSWEDGSNIISLKYNVYIDGAKVSGYVDAGTYTYNQITSGKHTVYIRYEPDGRMVTPLNISKQVTVKGKNLYPTGNAKETTPAKTSTKSSSSKSGKEELKYLKQFLKTIDNSSSKSKQQNVDLEITKINYHHKVKILMIVQNGNKYFTPPVIEGLKVVWERKNTAGKMTFQTIANKKYQIKEGNPIRIDINGKKFFYGFVFTVKRNKDGKIDVTVYDQLRYLKAKDTYVYKNVSTNSLIKTIAGNMGMNVGTLEKTKHKVTRAEDNITLFDMISNSLNETLMATGNVYTLYDDCGKLMLKKPTSMKVLDCLIDAETAEDYTYNRSIDQDVYNQIKLAYTNDKGKTKFYYTKSKKNISKWGTLQYFEKIDYPKLAKIKGEVLLKLYNKVSKTLSISGAFGNVKVRAGSLIPVLLNLGDAKVSSFLLVDKVTHTFENGIHKMDLNLSGGGFDSSE